MSYALFTLLGLFALLGIYFLTRRNNAPQDQGHSGAVTRLSPQAQLHKLQLSQKFWGVRIESHCRASSTLAGREFPFDAVPTLPVEGCESAACTCVLVGMPERRSLTDRRSGIDRRRAMRMESNDRRTKRPRRKNDINTWLDYSHL